MDRRHVVSAQKTPVTVEDREPVGVAVERIAHPSPIVHPMDVVGGQGTSGMSRDTLDTMRRPSGAR